MYIHLYKIIAMASANLQIKKCPNVIWDNHLSFINLSSGYNKHSIINNFALSRSYKGNQ